MSAFRPQQTMEVKSERFETLENGDEFTAGKDDRERDCKRVESPATPGSDEDVKTPSKLTNLCPDVQDSDSDSSSTDCSSDSSSSLHSHDVEPLPPSVNGAMCTVCGNGPFRSIKLHLLHCSGVWLKYQCSLCKRFFPGEDALNEHYMPLYACEICGQVFSHMSRYSYHKCPKNGKSPLVIFCAETMPKVCNICKAFFTSEKTLLNHVTRVHTSVVSTKICIITNPSEFSKNKVSPCVRDTAAQSATGSPAAKSSPSFPSTYSSQPGRPATLSLMSTAATVGKDRQGPSSLSAPLPPITTDPSPTTATSDPDAQPVPAIMAMFENDSQDVALRKRMNTGWRAKVPYSCRQCGAVLRQPSFIISHRYLHRGRRSHQCQCGRAFKHRLHLLRHCVQHAEAINYICVSCGETFIGARLMAEHVRGKSQKKFLNSGRTWGNKVKKKCRVPFTCDCGQLFLRPSAYIWHQLQNWKKTKHLKKPLN